MPQDNQTVNSPASAQLYKLQQPEKLRDVLKQEKYDCLSCRLIGATAFIGLGAYSYYTGQKNLRLQHQVIAKSGSRFGMKARQGAITAIAASFVGLGLYRLIV